MYCKNCNKEYEGKFCPECGTKLIEKPSANGLTVDGSGNAIDLHTTNQTITHDNSVRHDSHNDNSQHYDQRGMIQAGTYYAAQTTEQDVVLKKEDRYRAACRRVYEDFVIDDVEIKQLKGLAQDLGLSDDRALSILNGVKQQMDAERAREEALNPRAQKRLQRLLSSMRENDVESVVEQLESFDEMVTEKNISELHFVYYLAQAALNNKKCIALAEKSMTDSYWRSFWSYVAYIKSGNKKEATRILDGIETKFSDYSADNTALLASVGELMLGNRKAADNEFLDVDESKLSPRLQRLFEAMLLILDPAEAKENNLREKDYLFYIKHIFNCETTEERENREREERKAREAEERRLKAEAEAKRKAEEKARIKAEQEAQRKREEEERKRKETEKAAKEKARKAEEAKRKREDEDRKRKEAESKRKAEAEEEARRKEEARKKHFFEVRLTQICFSFTRDRWALSSLLQKLGWKVNPPALPPSPIDLGKFSDSDFQTAVDLLCKLKDFLGKVEVSVSNGLGEPLALSSYDVTIMSCQSKWILMSKLQKVGWSITSVRDLPALPCVVKQVPDIISAIKLRDELQDQLNCEIVPVFPPSSCIRPTIPEVPSTASKDAMVKDFIARCIDYVRAKGSRKKDLESVLTKDIHTLMKEMGNIVSSDKKMQVLGEKLCLALVNSYSKKIEDCDFCTEDPVSVGDIFIFAAGYLSLYSGKKDLGLAFLKKRKSFDAYAPTAEAIEDYWNGKKKDAYLKLSKVCKSEDLSQVDMYIVPLICLYGYLLEKEGYEFELSFFFSPFYETLEAYLFELENERESTPSISWSKRDVDLLKEVLNQ